ncbi:hypothetical protein GMRT_13371 [Giardia muris]|uniref:Uncharacterized protein n=1 Tax=Giardia muris TaxID=5742 RepID=A0A4Z1SRS4_GIAMU|nr:hypothetical protein GMRT_13371 [Giardia muris]|eukprot:TNJ26338.1 hypothetical protein GMRT_13371 [Giardia muris]
MSSKPPEAGPAPPKEFPILVSASEIAEQELYDRHFQPLQVSPDGLTVKRTSSATQEARTSRDSPLASWTGVSGSSGGKLKGSKSARPATYSELVQRNNSLSSELAAAQAELDRATEYLNLQRDGFNLKERELQTQIEALRAQIPSSPPPPAASALDTAELNHLNRSIKAQLSTIHMRKQRELSEQEAKTRAEYTLKICQLEAALADLREENRRLRNEKADRGLNNEQLAELEFLRKECKRLSILLDEKEDIIFQLKAGHELDEEELATLRVRLAMARRDHAGVTQKLELQQQLRAIGASFGEVPPLDSSSLTRNIGSARPLSGVRHGCAAPTPTLRSRSMTGNSRGASGTNRRSELQNPTPVPDWLTPLLGQLRQSDADAPETADMINSPTERRSDPKPAALRAENERLRRALETANSQVRRVQADYQRLLHHSTPIRNLLTEALQEIGRELDMQKGKGAGRPKPASARPSQTISAEERERLVRRLTEHKDVIREAVQALVAEDSMLLVTSRNAKALFGH